MNSDHGIPENRIQELIKYAIPSIKQRWPRTSNYSDRAIAICFGIFYLSEDAGNNDEKFEEWVEEIPSFEEN